MPYGMVGNASHFMGDSKDTTTCAECLDDVWIGDKAIALTLVLSTLSCYPNADEDVGIGDAMSMPFTCAPHGLSSKEEVTDSSVNFDRVTVDHTVSYMEDGKAHPSVNVHLGGLDGDMMLVPIFVMGNSHHHTIEDMFSHCDVKRM